MNYVRQTPTEECPLTKDREKWSLSDCCGFRSIICSFIALTIIITAALILQLVYDDNTFQGKLNVHGAVATDNANCSQLGTKILKKGGNSVDAAIAATICMAVVAPHKTSLGSGGYIMIYSHREREVPRIIDFLNNTVPDEFIKLKIRIPSLLRGLEYAHINYGKLSWKDIVQPSILLAENGFEISRDFAYDAEKIAYSEVFEHINAGEILKLPKLANTLKLVAKYGADVFYNGTLTRKIFSNKTNIEALVNYMAKYEPNLVMADSSTFSNYRIFYPSTLNFAQPIIDKLNNLNISKENASSVDSQIIAAETIIKLMREINNPYINYVETRKYTTISAVDWQDTYVSVITGLTMPFDSAYKTETGFLLDNANSENSLLSFVPIIFYDKTAICGLRGVFGVDDSLVAEQILYNLLVTSMNVSVAIEYPRYYLLSDGIAVENDERYSENTLLHDKLIAIETTSKINANMLMKSVNIIIKRKNQISAHSDSRGDGLASRF